MSHSSHNFSHQPPERQKLKTLYSTLMITMTLKITIRPHSDFEYLYVVKVTFYLMEGVRVETEALENFLWGSEILPFIFKGCSCQIQIIVTCKFVRISNSFARYFPNGWCYVVLFCYWETKQAWCVCTSSGYSSRASNNIKAIRNSRRMNSWCHNMNV